jgi:hypothetical protein
VNALESSPERDDAADPLNDADAPPAGHAAGEADSSVSPSDPVTTSFPWPPSGGDSAFDAWGRTWHGASLEPRRLFSLMPRDGSLGAAVLYYLSIGIAVAGAQLFWAMVRGPGEEPVDSVSGAPGASETWSPLVDFLTAPVLLLLSLFLAAGVTHLMLKVFGAGRPDTGGYGTTVRVFAYAYSPQLLGVIPVAGVIAGFVWMVVVAIAGLSAAHRTSTGRAAAAVLIPLSIGMMFVALAVLIVRMGGLLEMPV